MYKNVFVVKTL